jgi:hypothetical protein
VNVRFTADPTSRWRGDEGLQRVDSGGSAMIARTAGIGASFSFPLPPVEVG